MEFCLLTVINAPPGPLGTQDLPQVFLAVLENSSHQGCSGEVDHFRRLRAFIYLLLF